MQIELLRRQMHCRHAADAVLADVDLQRTKLKTDRCHRSVTGRARR